MKKAIAVLLMLLMLLTACKPAGGPSEGTGTAPDGTGTQAVIPSGTAFTISEETLRDKIAGSWVAQMVGVTWGASTEFRWQGTIIPEKDVPKWNPSMVNDAFSQDDLYVEIPFIDAMKDHGVGCSLETVADYFRDSKFGLAHANYQGRLNLQAGIPAPDSGSYLYNYHADDIDWQIEADFLGNFYPGMISAAASRSFELGHIMNYGDGVYGGVYVAAMHAAAFTTDSLDEVIEAGRQSIPEGTEFRAVLDEVTDCYKDGMTWEECWAQIEEHWCDDDKCPDCSGKMNIDAKLNAAYILMGLLWGEGDFTETMKISMRGGQDSDCNPSSSAAVLGTLYGLSGLPEEYVSGTDYSGKKFAYTEYTLDDCIDVSMDLAKEQMKAVGFTESNKVWTVIKEEKVTPVPFEQWPDDVLTVYLTVTPGSEGKVTIKTAYVLPKGSDRKDLRVSFDLGDGTVIPGELSAYQYLADGTYTVKCTASVGGKTTTVSAEITVSGSGAKGFRVTPSCSCTAPQGGGSRDIGVITDGFLPKPGAENAVQYDTFVGSAQSSAWFALNFDHKVTVTGVRFTEGAHFDNGGWFKKTPSVEVLLDGKWVKAESTVSPLYMETDSAASQGDPFETFTFTLAEPVKCEGIRVTGTPGGSSGFASCAELEVLYSAVENPTYEAVGGDMIGSAIIVVSESSPAGAGCRDIEIIRDGIVPKKGADHATAQYDTFRNRSDEHEEYYGYLFRGEYEISTVSFTDGEHFGNGGWFRNGEIRVEVMVGDGWKAVDAKVSPNYPKADSQGSFTDYRTYVFTFDPVTCRGVRVIGTAGGSANFTGCSELSVE